VSLGRDARSAGLDFETFWKRAVEPCAPGCRQCVTLNGGRHQTVRVIPSTPAERRPAYPCIIWPSDRGEAAAWKKALAGTREAWARAYAEIPATDRERAVECLAPVLGRIGEGGLLPEQLAA